MRRLAKYFLMVFVLVLLEVGINVFAASSNIFLLPFAVSFLCEQCNKTTLPHHIQKVFYNNEFKIDSCSWISLLLTHVTIIPKRPSQIIVQISS